MPALPLPLEGAGASEPFKSERMVIYFAVVGFVHLWEGAAFRACRAEDAGTG